MTTLMDIGVLVGHLSDRIEALAEHLLPNGRREGHEWRCGSVQGEAGRSMAVHLAGPRAGVWCDFGGAPDDRGDALDLIAAVLFRGDKKQALRWARAWLGIDRVDPASIPQQQAAARAKKKRAVDEEDRNRRLGQHMFLSAKPQLAGTWSEIYLRGRGIDFARLGRQPGALRHHDELTHPETGEVCQGLVAAITAPDGGFLAVHRTFLERLADGRVVKLRGVEDAKLTLGRYAGGCIRLWRGASGKAWRDMPAGEWIVAGEGIEDTATAVMAAPEYRAVVAVSLSNLAGIVLPAAAAGVIILAQNDPEMHPQRPEQRHPARISLDRAVAHFQGQGKRVRLARPTADQAHDLNELAQRELKQGTHP